MDNFSINNVFITKSNMKEIIKPVDLGKLSSINLLSDDFASQNLAFILSIPEQNWLKAFKLLCENPSLILDKKYRKIPKGDTKSFVLEKYQRAIPRVLSLKKNLKVLFIQISNALSC